MKWLTAIPYDDVMNATLVQGVVVHLAISNALSTCLPLLE